ncbi:MAG: hypothetical protein V4805_13170 [Pseudomonadota bacterium]
MKDANIPPGAFAFGIAADTGLPLEGLAPADLPALMQGGDPQQSLGNVVTSKLVLRGRGHFGLVSDCNPDDLSQAGWGLIFAAEIDSVPLREALAPLIALRQSEAGRHFRIFDGEDGYQNGESANDWLERHGASLNLIDPDYGVPFYLAIVGAPSQIPFSFQYSLDLVAAVGRIDFRTEDEYRQYAQNVVAFESDSTVSTRRDIAMFATRHDFDAATQLFTDQVAMPLALGDGTKPALGSQYGFKVKRYFEEAASKKNLQAILRGEDGTPSILFTGTHGMAFKSGDERQADSQGALVCADWPGVPPIDQSHWFAASDVPDDAKVSGLIHFFFACYGAGTPEMDNFNQLGTAKKIAPSAMTARLPQVLMTRGALASLGHIDKAWASSFQSAGGSPQTQGFRNVIGLLMKGMRVGYATDMLNAQWGTLSTQLAALLERRASNLSVDESRLLSTWIARDDARNYVILGDPAVKLRPEPLT